MAGCGKDEAEGCDEHGKGELMIHSLLLLFAQAEVAGLQVILEEIRKQAAKSDQTGMIYLFVLVVCLLGVGGFFVLRYMLTHAREIHAEANKTLLEISSKYDARFAAVSDTFSRECTALRGVILRTLSDSRDMVHATRDIAQIALSGKEFAELYAKRESELKAKRDRDETPLNQ